MRFIVKQAQKPKGVLATQKGFTLIELLVILGVIIVLAGVAYASGLFDGSDDAAKRAATMQDFVQIREALIIYKTASIAGTFPATIGDLATGLTAAQCKDGVARTNLAATGRTAVATTWTDAWGNAITYDRAARTLTSTAGGGTAIVVNF